MFKKLFKGAAAAAVASAVVFGTDAFSYLRTGAANVRDAVKSEVPVEFELERARTLVADLGPEIKKSLHVIAEEQVAVQRLERAVDKKQASLAEQELAIKRLRDDVDSGETHFVYAGRGYDLEDVSKDLSDRFRRYEVAEETLVRQRQVLDAKRRNLLAHRDQLDAMLSARKDLEVEIERLQARLSSVKAAESVAELDLDDSALTRARSLIGELDRQLEVRERMVDESGALTGGIPVEAESAEVPVDLMSRIDAKFGGEPAKIAMGEVE